MPAAPPSAIPRAGAPVALAARYREVRRQTEALAAPLSPEDCTAQSMPDASPVKWHLAHTSWFFETFVLESFAPGFAPFDPAYRTLFNSYYRAVGDRHPRPERGLVTRPGLEEIRAYRRHVDDAVDALLASGEAPPDALARTELGLHHEQQHQELVLTDLLHLLSCNPTRPAYAPRPVLRAGTAHRGPGGTHRRVGWVRFAGGVHAIGFDGRGFAFDNERPRHDVLVAPFEIASRPVTCGEYLAFIDDGGYRRPELWLSLGFDAVEAQGWTAPLHWERHDDGWRAFTLHGMAAIEPDAPVAHVSYFEADAFARWAGARLPTEAEWEIAAAGVPVDGNFLESGHLRPVAATGRDAGLAQLFGDVWEWTQSAYAPYPGYQAAEGALGEYNGKFMCNQYVLRGGSCATPRSHLRASYRNFFPPGARWQWSGLRLARDA